MSTTSNTIAWRRRAVAALTVAGLAAVPIVMTATQAEAKSYTPATWDNSAEGKKRLDGPGHRIAKVGKSTKAQKHTPLGAVKGPKGAKSPAFSVQSKAKAPAGKKATSMRQIKGKKAAALNYAIYKHGGKKTALSRAALAYLAYSNFDVSKSARAQFIAKTPKGIKSKAAEYLADGVRNRGVYSGVIDVTGKSVKFGVKSASGKYVPGFSYRVTLSGPATFAGGKKVLTGKTAASVINRAVTVTGDGKITAKVAVSGLPKDFLTVKRTKGHADVIVPNGTVTKRATDSVTIKTPAPPEVYVPPTLTDVYWTSSSWPIYATDDASDWFSVVGLAEGSHVKGQKVVTTINGVTRTDTVLDNGRFSSTFDASEVGAGTHEVTSTLTDAKGQTYRISWNSVEIGLKPLLTVTWTHNDGKTFQIEGTATGTWAARQPVTVDIGGVTASGTVQNDGTWSVTFNVADVPAGQQPVIVSMSDKYGTPAKDVTATATVN